MNPNSMQVMMARPQADVNQNTQKPMNNYQHFDSVATIARQSQMRHMLQAASGPRPGKPVHSVDKPTAGKQAGQQQPQL